MTTRTWSPRPALVGLAWALAACGAAWAVITTDHIGWLLGAVAAVGLGLLALHGTIARPRLAADAAGLAVKGLFTTHRWPWTEVTIKAARTRRLGRDVATLEIEAGQDHLVVLSRID